MPFRPCLNRVLPTTPATPETGGMMLPVRSVQPLRPPELGRRVYEPLSVLPVRPVPKTRPGLPVLLARPVRRAEPLPLLPLLLAAILALLPLLVSLPGSLVTGLAPWSPKVLAAPAPASSSITLTLYLEERDAATMKWYAETAKKFEAAHPGVKVSIVTNAGTGYYDKLMTLWAAGMPPDVWGQGGAPRSYQREGWLLDLTDFVKADLDELNIKDFFPAAWKAYEWDGRVWGLPFISVASPLFYNADLFDQRGVVPPPAGWSDEGWSWADMVATARKLTVAEPDGRLKQAGVGIDTDPLSWIIFSYFWGADWFDRETYRTGIVQRTTLDTPENRRAWTEVRALMWQDHVAPRLGDGFDAWSGFQAGKVGMHLGASPWVIMGKRDVLRFRWGMASQPQTPVARRTTIVYTDAWLIGSQTRHPKEAWELVKFLSSPETLKSYVTIADFPPARISATGPYMQRMASFSGLQSAEQIFLCLMGGQQYGRECWAHTIAGFVELHQIIPPFLRDIINNKREVGEALRAAAEAVEAHLKQTRRK